METVHFKMTVQCCSHYMLFFFRYHIFVNLTSECRLPAPVLLPGTGFYTLTLGFLHSYTHNTHTLLHSIITIL